MEASARIGLLSLAYYLLGLGAGLGSAVLDLFAIGCLVLAIAGPLRRQGVGEKRRPASRLLRWLHRICWAVAIVLSGVYTGEGRIVGAVIAAAVAVLLFNGVRLGSLPARPMAPPRA